MFHRQAFYLLFCSIISKIKFTSSNSVTVLSLLGLCQSYVTAVHKELLSELCFISSGKEIRDKVITEKN